MKLDALWSIEYATNHGDFGTGVVVMVAGHLYGGDSNFCYQGEYSLEGDELEGRIILKLHAGQPFPACSVEETITIRLAGNLKDSELEITGILEHDPTIKLFIHLTRQSELPEIINSAHDYNARAEAVAAMVSPHITNLNHSFLIGESAANAVSH